MPLESPKGIILCLIPGQKDRIESLLPQIEIINVWDVERFVPRDIVGIVQPIP